MADMFPVNSSELRDAKRIEEKFIELQGWRAEFGDLEMKIVADSIAYIVRNGFPDDLIYRLAEKYSEKPNVETKARSLKRVLKVHKKLLSKFAKFDVATKAEHSIDDELKVLHRVALAPFPEANRFEIAKALNMSTGSVSGAVTRLLDGGYLQIIETKNVLQLALCDDRRKLLQYAKTKKGFDKSRHGPVLESSIRNKIDELTRLSRRKRDCRIKFPMSSNLLTKKFKDLSAKQQALVQAYMRVVELDTGKKPITKPPYGRYYKGSDIDGNIVEFINRVYADHLDGINFGRRELAACDNKAMTALLSLEVREGKVPLDRLLLPTVSQINETLVAGFTPRQMRAAKSIMASAKRKKYQMA